MIIVLKLWVVVKVLNHGCSDNCGANCNLYLYCKELRLIVVAILLYCEELRLNEVANCNPLYIRELWLNVVVLQLHLNPYCSHKPLKSWLLSS
jgi:hypothetical protein